MATYYISTSGLTSNNGTTSATPWPISKFTTTSFVAGDNILFKKGDTFSGTFTFARSGSSGSPITIDAYGSGNNPTFDGANASRPVLAFNGQSFINISNIVIQNGNSDGISIINGHDFTLTNLYITAVLTGVNVQDCPSGNNIVYTNSYSLNMKGPVPKGQFIQLNNVNGSGIKITNNLFWNIQGSSNPEDAISIYQSNGTSGSPILVDNNHILGGGPSNTGGGIMTGDSGGSWTTVSNNILVNPGQYGLSISSGSHISIINNIVFAAKASYTNVGLYVWTQQGNAPSKVLIFNATVSGNRVKWTNSSGADNGVWLAAGETTPTGWASNNWSDGTVNASVLTNPLWTGTPWNSGAPASLVFNSLPTKTYGAANFAPGATSGTPITYTSSNTSVATIVSGLIHIVGAGTSIITASDASTSIPQTLTVNKAVLTVTGSSNSKNYATANPSLTVSYSGFVNSETSANLTTIPTATTSAITSSSAGSYNVVPSGGVSSNYSFTYVNGTLTINKVSLTITADSKSKAQGIANPTLTASYTGFVNGDTSASLSTPTTLTTVASTGSPSGTYSIVPSGAISTNYNITFVNGTLTITGANLVFNAIPSKVYGTSDFSPGATSSNAITYTSGTTSVATIVSGNIHIIAVGTSVITANDGVNSIPQTLTVTKASLTIQANNQAIAFGSAIPTLTTTYTGLVNGDVAIATPPTVATSAVLGSAVGTYAITVTGAFSNNYTVTQVAGTLTILPIGNIIFHIPVVVL